jgi:hypothetical protein
VSGFPTPSCAVQDSKRPEGPREIDVSHRCIAHGSGIQS